MNLRKFKKNIDSCKRIFELDTLGYFDFFTSTVFLESVYSEDMDKFRAGDIITLLKVVPLAVHEYTHFIDSTSTLWGLRHLNKKNSAYEADDRVGGKEEDFVNAKAFLEHVRSLRLPKYYTLVESDVQPDMPWQYRISTGNLFGLDGKITDKPVLFVRFINAHGIGLARSPLSVVSLLEASAMSQEISSKIEIIKQMEPNTSAVELKLYEKELISYIYNQNITEYSVCVHIIANRLQCKDVLLAFRACSIITRLVLNFPTSLFKRVLESVDVPKTLSIPEGHEFENRIKKGLENENLGILYYLLCMSLPTTSIQSKQSLDNGVGVALASLGIDLSKLIEERKKEINFLVNRLEESKISAIRTLSTAGKSNIEKIDLTSGVLPFNNLSLPSVYLGDGEFAQIFKNGENELAGVNIEEIYDELDIGREWVERFSEACTA